MRKLKSYISINLKALVIREMTYASLFLLKLLYRNWLFLFLRNMYTLLFQVAKISILFPLFVSFIFIRFFPPLPTLTITAGFLGIGRDKVYEVI